MIIVMMMDIYANLTLLFRWQIRAGMNNRVENNANLEHIRERGGGKEQSLRISFNGLQKWLLIDQFVAE